MQQNDSINEENKWKSRLTLALKGFAMGSADVVPGVSGGTIALITGIYSKLIEAIDSVRPHHFKTILVLLFFWKKEKRERALADLSHIHWGFLLPLLTGILFAILSMAKLIKIALADYIFFTYSFFFGLVLYSLTFPYKLFSNSMKNFAILIFMAVITFFSTQPGSITGSQNYFYVFISGAIAICAMILPGISGSYILLIMGEYQIIFEAIHNVTGSLKLALKGQAIDPMFSHDLTMLLVFIGGILVGILSFVRLLKYLLENYMAMTMAALTGIMAGSLRALWPYYQLSSQPGIENPTLIFAAMATGGIALVFLLQMATREKNSN